MTKQQMKVIAQAEHEMFCLRDLLEGSVPAKVCPSRFRGQ